MKSTLAVLAVFVLALGTSVAGQSRNTGLPTSAAPVSAMLPDLNTMLADLKQAADDAKNDLAKLQINKWGKNSNNKEAEHTAISLQRNLAGALPALIAEVRNSHGSVAASFKLYDDLSVLCETLDPLVVATETYGKKEEYGPLADDFSRLTTIRRSLSSYIEAKAAALESKSNAPVAAAATSRAPKQSENTTPAPKKPIRIDDGNLQAASTISSGQPAPKKPGPIVDHGATQPSGTQPANTQLPKKIVIDDNVPEEKPAKKKATTRSSNQ
jgi:hypothetical protein